MFDGCFLLSVNQWCKKSNRSCTVQYYVFNFVHMFDVVAVFVIFVFCKNFSVKICKYIRLSIHSTVFDECLSVHRR